MAYTPELNKQYSGTLRRIAWAANIPMTKAITQIIDKTCEIVSKEMICDACKDTSFCGMCVLNNS